MADKRIHELDELTTPQSNDLLVMEQVSSNVDKKVKMSNFMPTDTIATAVNNYLDGHSGYYVIPDGNVTMEKLATDVHNMFDEKADIDGYYEDMSVGSAEQLLSNMFEDDSDPYLFRSTAGSKEVGDRVYEDAMVGASVAWNQLVQNGDFSNGTTGWTGQQGSIEVSENKCTWTASSDDSSGGIRKSTFNGIQGHKYLCSMIVTPSKTTKCSFYLSGGNTNSRLIDAPANVRTQIISIVEAGNNNTGGMYGYCNRGRALNTNDTCTFEKVFFSDLTQMFANNPAIADYAYTLETSEAGSGIAWLKSQGFFTKDYYAYNAGGIQSVKTSAKKVVGFNQWDEQWESGTYSVVTGEKQVNANTIRSKNYIPVLPNTVYNYSQTLGGWVLFYDSAKNYISGAQKNVYGGDTINSQFTTPNNCYYITFYTATAYGTTYNNDICINFHWDGERDGEYEAYEEKTYPLDSDLELRGVPKLVDGKIKYDGDLYASDGSVTRKYGIVDLGTLNYTDESSGTLGRFYTGGVSTLIKKIDGMTNLVCSLFVATPVLNTVVENNGYMWVSSSGNVSFSKNGYSTAADFKTAMSGVYLVYELATPTTESTDPYTNPQWVDNWGTEEFIDERDVPVPVGHDSRYLPDLKAKVESAPSNPSTNGLYFLQYQNGEATYVPVPSEVPEAPSEDGTYVLKATVTSGTATLSWVAEE